MRRASAAVHPRRLWEREAYELARAAMYRALKQAETYETVADHMLDELRDVFNQPANRR